MNDHDVDFCREWLKKADHDDCMSSEELLTEAVARIIHEIHPEKIILFGSRARGDDRSDSDVDLLVVASEETIRCQGRRRLLGRFWAAMGRLPAAFDFLLFSPKKWPSGATA